MARNADRQVHHHARVQLAGRLRCAKVGSAIQR
jgi:hypothetical protein